jgi:hypothetical protein
MDNDVQQFRQNAREGQWCPIGPTVRPGRVFISLPQSAPVKQDGSYRTIQARTYNASYKESSGERLSSSKRLSQGKEKVSGSFGYLALGGSGRRGCPRLTLHEELHSLGHLSRSAQGCARISRMQVSVQDGGAVTVVLDPSWYPIQTPFGTGCIPKRSFQEYGTEHWSPL